MVAGFAQMIRRLPHDQPNKQLQLAIVVSAEPTDYRPEMLWLAARLRDAGLPAQTVSPEDVIFTEEGLFLAGSTSLTVLYRVFELLHLAKSPKCVLILLGGKHRRLA